MELNPYLTFDGRCQEALEFYASCLGGEIVMMTTHEGSPMAGSMPPDWVGKIMHGRIKIGDKLLMGSDAPPEHYSKPAGVSVAVTVDDPSEAERIFAALAEGGSVRMPIQQTFWAAKFGMLTDRFGIPWLINGGETV